MKPKIKSCLILNSYCVAAFDEHGHQVPELQRNLLVMLAEVAAQAGYDPEHMVMETACGNFEIVQEADGSWNSQIAAVEVNSTHHPSRRRS